MRVGVFWRAAGRMRVPRPSAVLPPFFSCILSAATSRRNDPVRNQTTVLPTKNELKTNPQQENECETKHPVPEKVAVFNFSARVCSERRKTVHIAENRNVKKSSKITNSVHFVDTL
ncbi:hypothetical protein B5X24_HaOG203244 [Helicoverpa armigera]|uniref:Uncharacterized protein n=1 Tax=Helicoverpa armigera TaxID=29058 RepID=A0A2W1BT60_HELAM|nr:hypothetical protein B5X24_HaOG203244 [Helicoverpa armigera]